MCWNKNIVFIFPALTLALTLGCEPFSWTSHQLICPVSYTVPVNQFNPPRTCGFNHRFSRKSQIGTLAKSRPGFSSYFHLLLLPVQCNLLLESLNPDPIGPFSLWTPHISHFMMASTDCSLSCFLPDLNNCVNLFHQSLFSKFTSWHLLKFL